MLVGGMRALIIQSLHPLAMAGVAQHSNYRTRGLYRLRRTVRYVLTVTFGDTESAEAAGAIVRRVHEHIEGVDPVTGRHYSASDPETLLWVHCVEVHSFLAAYRAYGGALSRLEQDQYFAESARSAVLVGIPKAMVPTDAAAMRAYFERLRPSLCVSQSALDAIRFVSAPPLSRKQLARTASMRIASSAAIGLVPGHLRALAGLERPFAVDALTHATVLAAARLLSLYVDLPFAEETNLERLRRMTIEMPFATREPRRATAG
jgi:uncharacterized protein (DUF2236 family)